MHRVGPNLISVQDATLEAGKPFYNLDSSFMKLQGLSAEVRRRGTCSMRWDPSAGCCVKGFDNSPVVTRRVFYFSLITSECRWPIVEDVEVWRGDLGGGKGVNEAWLTYQ